MSHVKKIMASVGQVNFGQVGNESTALLIHCLSGKSVLDTSVEPLHMPPHLINIDWLDQVLLNKCTTKHTWHG